MIDLTTLPLDITTHILNFRDFLNKANPCLDNMMENHSWKEDAIFWYDWMQLNWEFLIERELLGENRYLFPISGFRITFPEKQAQFKIHCETSAQPELRESKRKYNYNGEELLVFGFYTFSNGFWSTMPPFDYVQVCTHPKKTLYIVPINVCRFILKEI